MESNSLFLYHLTLTRNFQDPACWDDAATKTIQQHAEFLSDLGQRGILAFAGRTDFEPGNENLFGIAVIRASSLNEAQEIMAGDPAVVAGIQQASIFPFSMGIRHFQNL